ncbi:MAG: hypothetical protein ABIH26_12260 [Candidatus Eisenbacteria bacterium]
MLRSLSSLFPQVLVAALAGAAFAEAPRIVHTPPPPPVAGSKVDLVFTVLGEARPAAADVFFRAAGEEAFVRFAAEEQRGVYRAAVPERLLAPPGFEYFLLVRTESGQEITSPSRSPAESPHRVPILSPEAVARILILSPERDQVVQDPSDLAISVLFDPPLAPDDSASLILDGAPVMEGVERTEDYLFYKPARAPARGPHTATAAVVSASGERGERSWTFYVGEGPRGTRRLGLSGRAEAGWAAVANTGIEGDPYVLYEKTSSLAYDVYASGEWGGKSIFFTSSRDPVYDDEIRSTARLSSETFVIEAGDIYPSFSEMTVSWLTGEGALATVRRGPIENTFFVARSTPSDTTGGIGIYSQFISGERLSLARDPWEVALHAAYGWERESSVPETLRFLPPVKNLVVTGSMGLRIGREQRVDVEAGWSDTEESDTVSAGAYRIVATLLDTPSRGVSIEYHDYRPDFYSLASPTVDGGERGVVLSGSVRLRTFLRQSLKVEVYRDRESAQELDEDSRIVQLYGRSDFDWNAGGFACNNYLLWRSYEIPYASQAYRSAYGTLGFYARGKTHTISVSGTRTDTRSSSRTRGWSGGAYWTRNAPGGRISWKLGERYTFSETKQDTSGTGIESTLAKPERWFFTAECGVELAGVDWRAEYERIDENDPAEKERFTQHLFLVVAGRKF